MKKIVLLALLITFINCQQNRFVATNEWQELEEGQSVPSGLHYRINLTTGKKEAKLLDNEDKSKEISVLPKSEEKNEPSIEELLKNIPSDNIEYTEEKIKELKTKYKSYKEIKDEFKKMDMGIKTEGEIVQGLFKRYENATEKSEILLILEDFESLAHQVDNSLQFLNFDGLEKIILPNLVNQSDLSLRVSSLHLIGALTQNHPQAQIIVFEKNFGDHLKRILSSSKSTEELTMAIYAYGSLIRNFPFAQNEILHKSGLSILIDLLSTTDDIKIKVKILVLISDLITEYHEAVNDEESTDRFQQYQLVDTKNILNSTDFCQVVETFLVKFKLDFVKEVELIEKVVQSLSSTQEICFNLWSQSPMFRHVILVLKNRFENSDETDEDLKQFLIDLSKIIDNFYNELYKDLLIKDEL